jgi:hypothetical protein
MYHHGDERENDAMGKIKATRVVLRSHHWRWWRDQGNQQFAQDGVYQVVAIVKALG